MTPHRNTTMLVLGNGARQFDHDLKANIVYTFNGATPSAGHECIVKVSTAPRPKRFELRLETTSEGFVGWVSQLSLRANVAALEQQRALGCVPSSGFCVVHTLWGDFDLILVDGVSFNPTLCRPSHLSSRTPLPQMFHNWLGERRLSYKRWLESPKSGWRWPLVEKRLEFPVQIAVVGYTALLEAFTEATDTGSIGLLELLAKKSIEPNRELLGLSAAVRSLERCFYLDRRNSYTTNWWLYDANASLIIERLAGQLRHAQSQTFRLAALGSRTFV